MTIFTPDQIIKIYRNKEINKSLTINYFKNFIEEAEDDSARIKTINLLGSISENETTIYSILENISLSDTSRFVRKTAIETILRYFSEEKFKDLLKYIIKNEKSPIVLYSLLELIENNRYIKSIATRTLFKKRLINSYETIKYSPVKDKTRYNSLKKKSVLDQHRKQKLLKAQANYDEARVLLELEARFNNYSFGFRIKQGCVEELRIIGDDTKELYKIIEILRKFKRLRSLDLSNNNLNSLPDSIKFLTHLRYLNLKNNKFKHFPEVLLKLKNLKYLYLDENYELQSVSETFWKFTQQTIAKKFILKGVTPEEAPILGILEILRGTNFSSYLTDSQGHIINLTSIPTGDDCDCDFQISFIPEQLLELKSLKELDLSDNLIKIIPQNISKLENLRKLNLKNNKIKEIPISLCELKNSNI